jgi:flagellar biosynthetic protein FliR
VNLLNFTLSQVKLFSLVLVRVTAFMLMGPVFGRRMIPPVVTVSLSALLALLLTPLVKAPAVPLPDDPVRFGLLAGGEILVGLVCGFIMFLVFMSVQLAGQVVDMQMGFGVANVIHPGLGTQVPLIGFFQFLLATLFFLLLDGHLRIIELMAFSFDKVPVAGVAYDSSIFALLVRSFGELFSVAIRVAAPALGALLLTMASLGILGRLVPQINLLIVGFPLTIAVGLITVAASINIFFVLLRGRFDQMWRDVLFVLDHM